MFKRGFKGSIGSYFVVGLAAIGVFALADNVLAAGTAVSSEFNKPGHILISDQFNNRVIETTTDGTIVWSFGLGPNDFSEQSVIGVNDAQRVGRFTLMAGTGTPPGVIPQAPNGAVDNRVILVSPKGKIVWQYGQFGQTGSAADLLSTPVQCTWLPNFHVLITDQGNNRIIEVNLRKEIVWQYPGSNTNPADQLNSPNSAELLDNGHILISDENNVWQYATNTDPLSIAAPLPTRAVRLRNGDTLISDQFNNRVIRVSPGKQIIASYGLPLAGGGAIGNNVGYDLQSTQKGMYSPYDAKVVGDYTGLTPPIDFEDD